jgi:hypothetical protein
MLKLRRAPLWRTAGICLLLFVLILTIMPTFWFWPHGVDMLRAIGAADKWAHGIAFAGLTVWFAGQYHRREYWRIAIGLLMFGILIELVQRMIGYRSAEWLDVAADLAGILVGLVIAATGLGGWSQRFEARFLA